jgi:hypothetical protein
MALSEAFLQAARNLLRVWDSHPAPRWALSELVEDFRHYDEIVLVDQGLPHFVAGLSEYEGEDSMQAKKLSLVAKYRLSTLLDQLEKHMHDR